MSHGGTAATAILFAALSLAGCAEEATPRPVTSDRAIAESDVRPEILTQALSPDSDTSATPIERLGKVEFAAAGELIDFVSGPTIRSPDDTGRGYIADRFVVARVSVADWIKGSGTSSTLLIAVPAGAEMVDSELNPRLEPGTHSPVLSVRQFLSAIPPGTRLIVMANEFSSEIRPSAERVVSGLPLSSPVLLGVHPEAIVVEGEDNTVTQWPEHSFSEVLDQLTEGLFTQDR